MRKWLMDQIKHLGITKDDKRCWTPHISNVKAKASKTASRFKSISRRYWGFNPRGFKRIYIDGNERIILCVSEV